jgi:hypothetical protein
MIQEDMFKSQKIHLRRISIGLEFAKFVNQTSRYPKNNRVCKKYPENVEQHKIIFPILKKITYEVVRNTHFSALQKHILTKRLGY